MTKTTRFLALFVAICAAGSAQKTEQKKAPSAADILDRYVEATGGKARYEALRSQMAVANTEVQGKGLKSTLEMFQAAGGLSYVVSDLPGAGKMEQGTAEGVAWERSVMRGPRVKSGEEKSNALREADLRSRLDWRRYYPTVELAGTEIVDVSECYKVVMTPAQGKPETRYFDKNTGLMVKLSRIVSTAMGEIPTETRFSDYRQVDGFLTPFRLEQKLLNMTQVTTLEKLNYNVDIPAEKFALPDEIRSLAGLAAPPKPAPKPADEK